MKHAKFIPIVWPVDRTKIAVTGHCLLCLDTVLTGGLSLRCGSEGRRNKKET